MNYRKALAGGICTRSCVRACDQVCDCRCAGQWHGDYVRERIAQDPKDWFGPEYLYRPLRRSDLTISRAII